MADMGNYQNLLALLQSGALGPGNGPIPAQNPQPGFRAPGTPGMQVPQQQPQGMTPQQGMAGLSNALAMFRNNPGAQPSTSGAIMGAPENDGYGNSIAAIQGLQPNADGTFTPPPMPTDIGYGQGGGGGFFGFLKGLF